MKDFLILLLIACTVTLGLYLLHRHDKPEPQETHTTIPKNTKSDCEPSELTLECNGIRPR